MSCSMTAGSERRFASRLRSVVAMSLMWLSMLRTAISDGACSRPGNPGRRMLRMIFSSGAVDMDDGGRAPSSSALSETPPSLRRLSFSA